MSFQESNKPYKLHLSQTTSIYSANVEHRNIPITTIEAFNQAKPVLISEELYMIIYRYREDLERDSKIASCFHYSSDKTKSTFLTACQPPTIMMTVGDDSPPGICENLIFVPICKKFQKKGVDPDKETPIETGDEEER